MGWDGPGHYAFSLFIKTASPAQVDVYDAEERHAHKYLSLTDLRTPAFKSLAVVSWRLRDRN